MEISRRMQRFLHEGKLSSSAGTPGADTKNSDEASSPGKEFLLGRASSPSSEGVDTSPRRPVISEPYNPSTSTSSDQDLPSNITTDNSAGGSDHSTTQSLESWQTQLQHLHALLNNFHSELDSELEELRAIIDFASQNIPIETVYPPTSRQSLDRLAHDWRKLQDTSQTAFLQVRSDLQHLASTTAVAVAVAANSPHTSARNTDGSDNDDDKDGNAAAQTSPSQSLMGLLEPSSTSSTEASDPDSSRGEQGLGSLFLPSSPSASASASSDSASLGS
jgi:hypothetical protein